MKRFFLVLLLSGAALAQTCQVNNGPLFSRNPTVGGTGACDAGPQTANEGNVVTWTDVYHDTVTGDKNSVSPDVVLLNMNSAPVTNTGACYYQPQEVDPKLPTHILSEAVSVDCFPVSSNNITAATSTADFNRFIAQIYPQTVQLAGNTFINPVPTGKCIKGPNFTQTLVQWPGVACATKKAEGGGCGASCDPCLDSATVGLAQGPTGSFTSTGGGGGPTDPLCSPIIIDTEGEGFHLTSAADGVMFDINGTGHPIRIAWTASGSHNAFLALDRDGSGTITSGKELFGNFTAQPKSDHPNGFLALAEFDKPEHGGNNDGIIDERDAVFPQLRLWIDANHDGIAQPDELHKLPELGIYSLGLSYVESRKTDEFGNQFRYRDMVNPGLKRDKRDEVGRYAYDIFFVTK